MIPNYELFLHGFNAMATGPEPKPLPLWMRLAYGGFAGVVVALSLVVG